MKVEFHLSIGLAGANQSEIVEVPNDFSEDDIEEEYQEWKNGFIEAYWKILDGVKDE